MSKITQYDAKVRKYFDIATFCRNKCGLPRLVAVFDLIDDAEVVVAFGVEGALLYGFF